MAEESVRKKARTEDTYQLFYWPGIPGRGEPIRLAFEEKSVHYEDVAYTKGVEAITAILKTETETRPGLGGGEVQDEAHDTHHPISTGAYYEEQKDAAKERAKDFRENRIPEFFKHFEAVLESNKESNGEWLYGSDLTYADLGLYHLVEGLLFAFPRAVGDILEDYPKLLDLHRRVKIRPRIASYLESDRRHKFSNGLYRHYEELDAPEKDV